VPQLRQLGLPHLVHRSEGRHFALQVDHALLDAL
jgi:hypothetical protein